MAFTDDDEAWQLVWMESRLRCIERAENITYNIPGLRSHDCFPQKIYYFATQRRQRKYWDKYSQEDSNNLITSDGSVGAKFQKQDGQDPPPEARLGSGSPGSTTTPSRAVDVEVVRQGQEELRQGQEELKRIQGELKRELKQELRQGQEELKQELKQSQADLRALQNQLAEMKEIVAVALKART
ncbi:hypothetical protein BGZ65_011847 [Modicella reniformis]|uniref:Uncharacterized protein n=1 Tax=Modicella reniformis TaxID=1440133 RepID=A0A9P6JFI1_9FUNG|nr:hypothetical protein BGZ65_011847 [Modicella reniformis]